jgi:hypothetical protein
LKDGVTLNKKFKKICTLTVKKELSIDTIFDPSLFLMDYVFNEGDRMKINKCHKVFRKAFLETSEMCRNFFMTCQLPAFATFS